LLLGPPSFGKNTLLLALAGKLDPDLKVKKEFHFSSLAFYFNWLCPTQVLIYSTGFSESDL